jgi:hypothetical protein
MEKLTYTPAEFAALFGKERTWAYRQLNAGKVHAITELGRTQIPKNEVERLLGEAGRYLGAHAKVMQNPEHPLKAPEVEVKPASKWASALRQRMKLSRQRQANAHSVNDHKPS